MMDVEKPRSEIVIGNHISEGLSYKYGIFFKLSTELVAKYFITENNWWNSAFNVSIGFNDGFMKIPKQNNH